MTWYLILKFVHVLSVVTWVGSATALTTLTLRLVGAKDRAALVLFLPRADRYGRTMIGPSSVLVLLTGIAMVIVGRVGFQTLWIQAGFLGILLHFALGATVMRRNGLAVARIAAESPPDDARLA